MNADMEQVIATIRDRYKADEIGEREGHWTGMRDAGITAIGAGAYVGTWNHELWMAQGGAAQVAAWRAGQCMT